MEILEDKELRREINLDNYQNPMNRGLINDTHYIKENTNNESCIDNIDILINNAAICLDNSFEDKTYMEFSKVVNVNLTGTYYLTKLLSKKINNGGNILFISSTNGIDTYYIESIDYDASKAGVISLMHNFAKQLAPIRVNAIAPGWVDTEMNASMSDKFKKKEEEHILLKRFASPEEISKVINFVISDDASYINDTVIRVDGGVNNG